MLVRRAASTLLAGGIVAGSVFAAAGPALANHVGDVFAVNINNTLFETSRTDPGTVIRSASILGLQQGENVVGIDFRPVDGEIYGITDKSRIYRIEYRPTDAISAFGTATLISTLTNSTDGSAVSLNGVNFGVNFNPTVDRLRVVSDLGQNLRINVDTGVTIVDGSLNYAAGDANAGKQPRVTAAAYTNPVPGATTTELFDIDPGQNRQNDIISKQTPPNNGTLVTRGTTGLNSTNLVGYDIGADNFGVASLIDGDGTQLYNIQFDNDPATNDAPVVTYIGQFADVINEIRDVALGIPDPDGRPGGGPDPVVPEFPFAALAPVLGLGIAGAVVVLRRRREV